MTDGAEGTDKSPNNPPNTLPDNPPNSPASPSANIRPEDEKQDPVDTDDTRAEEQPARREYYEKKAAPKDDSRHPRFIKDPEGDRTHDETTVDVVTVPCPGGDPLRSWNRDGLLGRYFGALSMRDTEVDRPGTAPSWVRQGIRREADVARILLYEHPQPVEGTTLGGLAHDLLEEFKELRDQESRGSRQRPVVFIAHSVGGLVVKMALVEASRDAKYSEILRDCYGVVFFGTPHQGSSYFAVPGLSHSIQRLLQLSVPLPTSITKDLCLGDRFLLNVDVNFKAVAHDIRIWTLYETIDSRLSGGDGGTGSDNAGAPQDKKNGVYFTAPLASIKSAILGMRQELVFPLQSDHANVASFGRQNTHTLRIFLRQLAYLINRADASVREASGDEGIRWTLNLDQKISVEVRGFFEDASSGGDDSVVRAWSTKLPLAEFLRKGPEECLDERLHEVDGVPDQSQFLRNRGRTMSLTEPENDRVRREVSEADDGLGIRNQLLLQSGPPRSSSVAMTVGTSPRSAPEMTGYPPQHEHIRRVSSPPVPTMGRRVSSPTRPSGSLRRPSPLIRPDFDQDLAIDRLSPPTRTRSFLSGARSVSDVSLSPPYEYRDFPLFSQQRSRSTMEGTGVAHDGDVVIDDSIDTLPRVLQQPRAEQQNTTPGTEAVADKEPATFSQPQADQRKFVWVHLPYNNPTWVNRIMQTLQTSYSRDYSALYGPDFWASKHTRGRHSQHYAYYARPGCYFTAPRTLSPRRSHSVSPPGSPFSPEDAVSLCLFLPYLHFDSYKRLVRRRNLIFQRLSHGRAHPIPEDVAKSDSMELQVIWEFLGHDPPINCRRTLDQFGYPALRDTRSRDDDQMLYKLTKERGCRHGQHLHKDPHANSLNSRSASYGSHGSGRDWLAGLEHMQDEENDDSDDGLRNGNVLIVDQMWLWVVHSDTLLSFFPKRESDPIEGPLYQQADLRDSIVSEVNVDLSRQCDNAFDLAALSALHAVSVLLDRASHPDLEVFRIFGEAISVLTEKLTSSLKAFRVEGFKDKASAYEPVENNESIIRRRHREEGSRAEQENRDNTSALLELRDLEDELFVLQELFERQQSVLSSMLTAYGSPALRSQTVHGRAFIAEAIRRVGEYRHRADDMAQRVRSTRDEYDKLLQMVQRQAQVDEVRLSRLHADLASSQGRSIMIFTIFTIIFLPLSFFTSVFGMNTSEWENGSPPSLKVIGAVALPASFLLVGMSLLTAFSSHARTVVLWVKDLTADILRWVYCLTLAPVVEAILRRWVDRVRTQRSASGRVDDMREARWGVRRETSDFWERHQPQKEMEYQIPEMNRRDAAKRRARVVG